MKRVLNIGIDVGSTTIKTVILDEKLKEVYSNYERHFSDVKNTLYNLLCNLSKKYSNYDFKICLTGSGAMSASNFLKVNFIQEVISCKRVVEKFYPQTDVVIELGGEDAKIIYFDKYIEQRMNGTCAGGTGAFLDQMASLLSTDTAGLNDYAKNYSMIYPIASRCGVFAKSDIQPLLNEGAAKEDIAASIFQAVVNQTISGLACGRPIKGNIAFLGGPLNYLPELRRRFIETLKLNEDQVIVPENAHLLVAKGAAIEARLQNVITIDELKEKIALYKESKDEGSATLPSLFKDKKQYSEFVNRHSMTKVKRGSLKNFSGDCFVGIDAGSTTTKLVLIDKDSNLLYSDYNTNEGSPLDSVIKMVKKLYGVLPESAVIRYSGVTGYGENLIKTALNIDLGEIETIAHYTAAAQFMPEVDSIVDIGGQDMKYIRIKNGAIDNIMLNEACSSGCGSFIQTFASSLQVSIDEFVKQAIEAKNPIDLGSRCTVFMNSKIKQAQKEGASVGQISAGLSYSVVKNAIQKVMKIRDVKKLGENIVVQGGTFLNDAVLRAFEIIVGKDVVRPDIAGLMGAYGVALLSKEQYISNNNEKYVSGILNNKDIDNINIESSHIRCKKCENNCLLTVNKFSNGKRFISGNRCEKGAGVIKNEKPLPNLYSYKYKRVFDYKSLEEEKAVRGTIGIPRVLNMYENYPFWHTFFTNLGFRVILSDKTSRKTYERGMESMPSESVCYPAKLTHGHIENLIKKGIKTIFYPCIPYENREYDGAENHYNCPIVISYSEVIKNNVEKLDTEGIKYINPFLPFDEEGLAKRILEIEEFKEHKFKKKELINAARLAKEEQAKFKSDVQRKGEEALAYIKKNNLKGIVLCGRPYHVDPEINHGIDTMITSLGMAVLSEDSISHLTEVKRPIRVVDQWVYHSRLYAAADVVGREDSLELVQLNSFGCGVDAVTTDQVEEILASYQKMYTLIKIDEVNNLGAVRIRIRSLMAGMQRRENIKKKAKLGNYEIKKIRFTKKMKKDHTILVPQMSPIHFELLEKALQASGYNLHVLKECSKNTVQIGLKYVNNDACYPSILVIGQLIEALESGKYDINNTSVMMSQTGGGCRATNYIGFLRKALKDAGFENVPVISFNVAGLEKNPGFKLTIPMAERMIKSVLYGDLLQKLSNRNRPYEVNKGETDRIYSKWMEKCKELTVKSTISEFKKSVYDMVSDFERIKLNSKIVKPRVGVVGEILIKYHPFGNNNVVKLLETEGAEAVMPDFMGFIKFMATHKITFDELLKTNSSKAQIFKFAIKLIDRLEGPTRKALALSKKGYLPPCNIWNLEKKVNKILSIGNQTGEGWYLTAEMVEYIEHGISNIICVQPFACLPNHVVGKGVIKTIRKMYPNANISPIDYDPGASESNQINRIKLLLTVANDNIRTNSNKKQKKNARYGKGKRVVKI